MTAAERHERAMRLIDGTVTEFITVWESWNACVIEGRADEMPTRTILLNYAGVLVGAALGLALLAALRIAPRGGGDMELGHDEEAKELLRQERRQERRRNR